MSIDVTKLSSIKVRMNYNYLTTTNYGTTISGSYATPSGSTVRKVVNLTASTSNLVTSPYEITIGIFTSGTNVKLADIFTSLEIHPGNSVCLIDKENPIILTGDQVLKAHSNLGSSSGSSLYTYCAVEEMS